MSEILARIRVREIHGIRRFLYPLTAYVDLPLNSDITKMGLVDKNRISVPSQIVLVEGNRHRLDLAVSMDPQADMELHLRSDCDPKIVDDPLHLTFTEDHCLQSTQKQFAVTIADDGNVREVVYDNVAHLKHPTEIRRLDYTDPRYLRGIMSHENTEKKLRVTDVKRGGGSLTAWSEIRGDYADGCKAFIQTEITACKSWVKTNYRLEGHAESETIIINIPFLATSSRVIFDTGIGDGLYGKVKEPHISLGWSDRRPLEERIVGYASSWYSNLGRGRPTSETDYFATIRAEELHFRSWFHLVDDTKAIAVAITKFPPGWREGLQIKLHSSGWIEIIGQLETESEGPATFGVCYHFLNDVPAIAAATNPQSVLLPPTVEVL